MTKGDRDGEGPDAARPLRLADATAATGNRGAAESRSAGEGDRRAVRLLPHDGLADPRPGAAHAPAGPPPQTAAWVRGGPAHHPRGRRPGVRAPGRARALPRPPPRPRRGPAP